METTIKTIITTAANETTNTIKGEENMNKEYGFKNVQADIEKWIQLIDKNANCGNIMSIFGMIKDYISLTDIQNAIPDIQLHNMSISGSGNISGLGIKSNYNIWVYSPEILKREFSVYADAFKQSEAYGMQLLLDLYKRLAQAILSGKDQKVEMFQIHKGLKKNQTVIEIKNGMKIELVMNKRAFKFSKLCLAAQDSWKHVQKLQKWIDKKSK